MFVLFLGFFLEIAFSLIFSEHDIVFKGLPKDSKGALFLGNGILGLQIWQNKDDTVRVVMNRYDMWDERPIDNFNRPEWKYRWIKEQILKNNYNEVVKLFANPYDLPGPTQILGGAIEFSGKDLGSIEKSRLHIMDGYCEIEFSSGSVIQVFVHPSEPVAWYILINTFTHPEVILDVPNYHKSGKKGNNMPSDLNYPPGKLINNYTFSSFHQPCWEEMFYDIFAYHNKSDFSGLFSISTNYYKESYISSQQHVENALKRGLKNDQDEADRWWKSFWSRSSINIPDQELLSQYFRDVFKIGCVSRKSKPVITLQDIWTVDNGKLPPWKNDVHNDMNTQVTYWGLQVSNHIEGELGFANSMSGLKDYYLQNYTKPFFEIDDYYNIPGMSSLAGHPLGGWVAYAFSPTVNSWMSKIYYDYYTFSMDKTFMEKELYPVLENSCNFFEKLSKINNENGKRYLPISASPEINDDTIKSWFLNTVTNFDLALIRYSYTKAVEIAEKLGKKEDIEKWKNMLSEWPDYAYDSTGGFELAENTPVFCSHRHFSHLLAWHPLALIDISDGEGSQKTINSTLSTLSKFGSKAWEGWSFVWSANFLARAKRSESAVEALREFVKNWIFPNSFHNNGGSVFTLEANMGFIAGLNEMLIQSHTSVIRLFPAIPKEWNSLSFSTLRARGAFLVSSEIKDGEIIGTTVFSEAGEILRIGNPYYPNTAQLEDLKTHKIYEFSAEVIEFQTDVNMELQITKKKEF